MCDEGGLIARNPVIRGFAPDPSLVRAGDWYYIATSSFEWFPTIPIHRSRDLAHWEYAGHVSGAVPGNSLAGVPDSGGIWAPSLSFDGATFWMVYAIVRSVGTPYFDLDTYVTTAPDPTGPWSPPRRVPSHGFDPALFHEAGRLWLLNLQTDHRPSGNRFSGITATQLDRTSLTPLSPTHLLLQHERLIEGPKLVHRDGWYHLILAEGGTGFDHGVLTARSRALTGPYELSARPLLTSRDAPSLPLQKAGHAELVETTSGEWFLSHLTGRPLPTPSGPRCTLGRETAVQALEWDTDGWPRLRGGGWHPAETVDVTGARTAGEHDAPASPDNGPHTPVPLTWPWSTLREPPSPTWADTTSRPGWIRLRGRQGPESRWAQSLLAQRLTEHHAVAQVTVEARPVTFTQAAGLMLRYDGEAYLSLDVTWAEPEGEGQRGQQWRGEGRTVLSLVERDETGAREVAVVDVDLAEPITLGVSVEGPEARFWYLRGDTYTPVGPALDASRLSDDHGDRLRFTGTLVGIHARDLVDAAFTADFRDFRLECEELPQRSSRDRYGVS
ncbi:family 43 glycosylhydrolase [Streptomyces roseirectus]|uniref:Family 43 glycosylhydrolase n=1 Tax=Streptomyces roseirectus TaxID=2768066 RepID=A0A7H0I9K5_9ACTN|nr:family 43 glycosylhydrolase [Streptomyces roseirectus]QNP69471.1 family 43 glycosylhydrolase [Streptomyces roseirectus]